ncbi:MAG: host attachment protein [Blastocatellia bacterium]|nr:host attachment protein [Blastocatellia bacterium]
MELKELQQDIRTLATLEETSSQAISCYLNLEDGTAGYRNALDERAGILRKTFSGEERKDFEAALGRIEEFIQTGLLPDVKGAAIFARGGRQPFFLPLQFRVPLPNWLVVNSIPNIYHLVELKDTYHRFVVMISTEESARIVAVNLGEVTEELWKERPELRKRVGRGWTKEHYQNHRRNRTDQFIKEKIQVLEQLMSAGRYAHLILAGNPRITARVRNALPKPLAARLVDTIVASGSDRISDVVAATISSFVEQEERESQAVVERLWEEMHTDGLAVVGIRETLQALQRSQVDVLVMAKAYESEPGWSCAACGAAGMGDWKRKVCSECGEQQLRDADIKEEMVRMAERNGCHVEIVNHSDVLMQIGGVGALLRYLAPGQYLWELHDQAIKQARAYGQL